LATRKVIGWSMNTHMRTSLIVDALNMAAGTGTLQPGCIFHSDYAEVLVKPRVRVLACAGGVFLTDSSA
jgi:transposase InsO family protein